MSSPHRRPRASDIHAPLIIDEPTIDIDTVNATQILLNDRIAQLTAELAREKTNKQLAQTQINEYSVTTATAINEATSAKTQLAKTEAELAGLKLSSELQIKRFRAKEADAVKARGEAEGICAEKEEEARQNLEKAENAVLDLDTFQKAWKEGQQANTQSLQVLRKIILDSVGDMPFDGGMFKAPDEHIKPQMIVEMTGLSAEAGGEDKVERLKALGLLCQEVIKGRSYSASIVTFHLAILIELSLHKLTTPDEKVKLDNVILTLVKASTESTTEYLLGLSMTTIDKYRTNPAYKAQLAKLYSKLFGADCKAAMYKLPRESIPKQLERYWDMSRIFGLGDQYRNMLITGLYQKVREGLLKVGKESEVVELFDAEVQTWASKHQAEFDAKTKKIAIPVIQVDTTVSEGEDQA